MRSDFAIILKQFVKFSNGNLPDTKIDSDVFESACRSLIKEDLMETIAAMKVAGLLLIQDREDWQGGGSYYELTVKGVSELNTIYKVYGESEKEAQIANLKNKLRQSFNILRGKLSVEEYFVLLYLLSLYNENGYLKVNMRADEKSKFSTPESDLSSVKGDTDTERLTKLYSFYEYFKPTLDKSPDLLFEISNVFQSLDKSVLKKNYPEIFDFVLYEIAKSKGKMTDGYFQPIDLSRFVCELVDLPDYANVYNPFAGSASFGIFLPEKILYLGQEISLETWVIGSLRLLAHNREGSSHFVHENSLEKWGMMPKPPENLEIKFDPNHFKHDLIIANPPFGMRLPQTTEGRFGSIKTTEHFTIEKGIEVLRPDGKLIAVLPQGFLFRSGSEQNLRRFLIENDLVEMVISFPGGMLMNTSIPFVIILISKSKNNKGYVRFIDAKNFVDVVSAREKKIKYDALNDFIAINKESESFKNVSNKEIAENDFNLLPNRYLLQLPEEAGLKIITLREVTKVRMKAGAVQPGIKGRYIRIRDLKSDIVNLIVNPKEIEFTEIPLYATEIEHATLLLALKFIKLRPSLVNGNDERIFVSNDILPLQVDESMIDIDYLLTELNSDYVQKQVEAYSYGSTIQSISKKDVLKLKIHLPSKEEQRAKVKGLREEYLRSRETEISLEREILGLKDNAFREFASMKHTFRQYLNALKSNVSGTRKFILNNDSENISLKTIYSENLNRTLGEHLLSLEGTIDSISKLLTSFDENSSVFNPIEGNLEKLVEEAQNRFSNFEIFHFEKLYIDQETFGQADGDYYLAPMVYIHPEDFFRLFSNVITNAVEHGFKKGKNNIIRTSLSFDAENLFCNLEISNNGKPMDDNFTVTHLITKGEKTTDSEGSGVGGADIKNILEKYNGTLEIKNDKDAEFPVTYVIGLPIVVYSI